MGKKDLANLVAKLKQADEQVAAQTLQDFLADQMEAEGEMHRRLASMESRLDKRLEIFARDVHGVQRDAAAQQQQITTLMQHASKMAEMAKVLQDLWPIFRLTMVLATAAVKTQEQTDPELIEAYTAAQLMIAGLDKDGNPIREG